MEEAEDARGRQPSAPVHQAYGLPVSFCRSVERVEEFSPGEATTYPTSRGVDSATVSARVEGMLAVGAKRSRIYDYLLEHDQNVLQVDVDNMVRAHSASTVGADNNEATARELAFFTAADKDNISSVADTAAGETGVISLATAHMRGLYSRFSELLLVDCTHKTNRYVYLYISRINQDFPSTNQDLLF
jgi:hypothetical protein